jgi:hypothetical protein
LSGLLHSISAHNQPRNHSSSLSWMTVVMVGSGGSALNTTCPSPGDKNSRAIHPICPVLQPWPHQARSSKMLPSSPMCQKHSTSRMRVPWSTVGLHMVSRLPNYRQTTRTGYLRMRHRSVMVSPLRLLPLPVHCNPGSMCYLHIADSRAFCNWSTVKMHKSFDTQQPESSANLVGR